MIIKDEAIVLRCVNYSNTSQIVALYSKEHGKVSVIAKGVRKGRPSKQFAGPLEPTSHIDVVFFSKSSGALGTLQEHYVKDCFYDNRQNLQKLFTSLYLIEFVSECTLENDSQPELFELLRVALGTLSQSTSPQNVCFAFQLQSFYLLGLLPQIEQCLQCGANLEKHCFFFPNKSGVICASCRRHIAGTGVQLHQETIQYFKRLLYGEFQKDTPLSKITVSESLLFFRYYLRSILNKELRTMRYLGV